MCCKWSLMMGSNFQFPHRAQIERMTHPERSWKNDLFQVYPWYIWCAINTRGRSDYNDPAIDSIRLHNTHFLALKDFKDLNAELKGGLYFRRTLRRKLIATLSLIPWINFSSCSIICIEYQLFLHPKGYIHTHIFYVFIW